MESLEAILDMALAKARDLPTGREASLIITKIQEAQMWYFEHRKIIGAKVKERTGSMKSYATTD